MNDTLEFKYTFTATQLATATFIMFACTGGAAWIATRHDAGPILSAASWVVTIASVVTASVMFKSLVTGTITRTYRITLTSTHLTAPKWSLIRLKYLTVPYGHIISTVVVRPPRARWRVFYIRTRLGTVMVNEPDLGKESFEQLVSALDERRTQKG